MLGDDDDDVTRSTSQIAHRIPAVRMHTEPTVGILNSLGIAGALRRSTYQPTAPRRDMLADEDTRSFGEWYNNRKREGTGGSSWSLRSILGGGVIGRSRSRNASAVSYGTGLSTPWREKSDPFSDGASPMVDEETGFVGAAAVGMGGSVGSRPLNRRETSYQSYTSLRSAVSYRDPFADPAYEEDKDEDTFDSAGLSRDIQSHEHPVRPSVRVISNLAPIQTVLPLEQGGHALSPLSEHSTPSQSTLPFFGTSGSSQGHTTSDNLGLSPFDSNSRRSYVSSLTSADPTPPLPSPTSTSIIGASSPSLLATNQPMRRSDSWWSKFSRTNLLDRRSSGGSRRMGYDIRDPNPPPKLGAIEERSVISTDKSSPQGSSPGSGQIRHSKLIGSSPPSAGKHAEQIQESLSKTPPSRAGSMKVYGAHGKSMSSVRTADSEAIERMAGTMDVVQRVHTRSHRGTGSTSSAGGLSLESHAPASISDHGEFEGNEPVRDDLILFTSPLEIRPPPLARTASPPSSTTSSQPPSRPASGGKSTNSSSSNVADKIKAFERKSTLETPASPSATNTKRHEERGEKKRVEVKYGLAPRRSLFVANPDRDRTGSGDS